MPNIQKPYPEGTLLIDLVSPNEFSLKKNSIIDVIGSRRTHRQYKGTVH